MKTIRHKLFFHWSYCGEVEYFFTENMDKLNYIILGGMPDNYVII